MSGRLRCYAAAFPSPLPPFHALATSRDCSLQTSLQMSWLHCRSSTLSRVMLLFMQSCRCRPTPPLCREDATRSCPPAISLPRPWALGKDLLPAPVWRPVPGLDLGSGDGLAQAGYMAAKDVGGVLERLQDMQLTSASNCTEEGTSKPFLTSSHLESPRMRQSKIKKKIWCWKMESQFRWYLVSYMRKTKDNYDKC